MLGFQARQETELNRLVGDGEGARNDRLAGDDRRRGGDADERQPRPVRRHQVEGILRGRRIAEQQRALAQIIERQAGIDQGQPRKTDRPAAEMAHVGIERLGARHRQEDRAQREERELGIVEEELTAQKGLSAPTISGWAMMLVTPSTASAAK